VTAELDAEMATDPFLPEVGWSWLTGARASGRYKAVAGAVTDPVDPVRRPVRHAGHGRHRDQGLVDPGRPRPAGACRAGTLLASTGLPPPGVTTLPTRLV
jgi:hypothetical protein